MKYQRQANLIKKFIEFMVLEVQGHDTGFGSALMEPCGRHDDSTRGRKISHPEEGSRRAIQKSRLLFRRICSEIL